MNFDRFEGAAERRVDDDAAAAGCVLLMRRCAKPAVPRADIPHDGERTRAAVHVGGILPGRSSL